MDEMSSLQAVAMAIRTRMAALALNQRELERKSHVSVATIRRLLKAQPYNYRPDVLQKLSIGLEWAPDRIHAMLSGEPIPEEFDPAAGSGAFLATQLAQLRADQAETRALVQAVAAAQDAADRKLDELLARAGPAREEAAG